MSFLVGSPGWTTNTEDPSETSHKLAKRATGPMGDGRTLLRGREVVLRRGRGARRMVGMGSGIDPTVDYVFKRVLGDEDNALLLVDLLNAVLGGRAGWAVRGV